jgi:hypothetical protein
MENARIYHRSDLEYRELIIARDSSTSYTEYPVTMHARVEYIEVMVTIY